MLTEQTLNLQVIVPKYRSADDGVLTIAGTLASDNLQVFVRDGQLRLVHNGTIRHFPLASVTKIEAHGFSGNDTISVAAPANVPTYVLGGGGNDTLTGGDQQDNLVGGGGKDHLIGNSGDDRHSVGLGHDYLLGGGHKDRLYGGDGNDTLHGGTGADRFYGDAGDYVLFARDRYVDLLTGGAGADTVQVDAFDRSHDLFDLLA